MRLLPFDTGSGVQEQFTLKVNGTYDATPAMVIGGASNSRSVGIGTTTPLSRLTIAGGASVGADYNIAAPTNGLIVEGNVGIGDKAPGAKLSVIGNAAIGYASGQTAPSNGLLVNGNVGIGTTTTYSALTVWGTDTACER